MSFSGGPERIHRINHVVSSDDAYTRGGTAWQTLAATVPTSEDGGVTFKSTNCIEPTSRPAWLSGFLGCRQISVSVSLGLVNDDDHAGSVGDGFPECKGLRRSFPSTARYL